VIVNLVVRDVGCRSEASRRARLAITPSAPPGTRIHGQASYFTFALQVERTASRLSCLTRLVRVLGFQPILRFWFCFASKAHSTHATTNARSSSRLRGPWASCLRTLVERNTCQNYKGHMRTWQRRGGGSTGSPATGNCRSATQRSVPVYVDMWHGRRSFSLPM
jgi:hypothetical protein